MGGVEEEMRRYVVEEEPDVLRIIEDNPEAHFIHLDGGDFWTVLLFRDRMDLEGFEHVGDRVATSRVTTEGKTALRFHASSVSGVKLPPPWLAKEIYCVDRCGMERRVQEVIEEIKNDSQPQIVVTVY
ncbi:MAG TPA: hypothetical protein PLK67_00120 [Bryobacteraceae bacterium]|nr:hypothetical protein [Bryobacteraceae bacterium]